MASGSSGRNNNSGAKGYDFSTDDVLCSYEDYAHQDAAAAAANGTHSDPNHPSHSAQEFHKNRMSRSSVFAAPAYGPPEDSVNQDVISAVEKTVKKHVDSLMRFLEGMSTRLSELELYCYNLDKSIGEMRSDLTRNHGEADAKLKSMEKHLQEVHRSVQIVRDKQELAETQKELAKLQLAQKEEARVAAAPVSDPRKTDNSHEMHGQQLALALPHQVVRQPSFLGRPAEQHQSAANPPSQGVTQPQAYYLPQSQMANLPAHPPAPAQVQPSQSQYPPTDSPYRTPQMQDISRVPPQPAQSQVNQAAQAHSLPHYQQQWPQQVTPLQSSALPQSRPLSAAVYPSYGSAHQSNPSQTESHPSSMPMQVSYSGIPQPGSNRAEAVPYGYGGGAGRTFQQQAPLQQQSSTPQPLRSGFGVQQNDGYPTSASLATLSPANAYMMYEGEPGRTHPQQAHFAQGGYPPTSAPAQIPQANATASPLARQPQQLNRNNPYGELVDKLVNMGYRTEHVANVIQRQEDSGQAVDFNAVLDRLNGHSTAGPQRGWSG